MPKVRDILDRFRPAGPPGAASTVGVPADRLAGAEAELAPVFAALAEAERRCADTRERAEREAGRRTAQAHRMAAAIVTRARSQERAERAATAAGALAAAEAESARLSADSHQAAAKLRAEGERRLPALVDLVVARARELAESATPEQP